jgi:hypothetical protein
MTTIARGPAASVGRCATSPHSHIRRPAVPEASRRVWQRACLRRRRPMAHSLGTLPSEIYSAILQHVPAPDTAYTTHSLVRALGSRAPVPLAHLFEFVYVRKPQQVFALYRRLRQAPVEASWVRELHLNTWTVDADLVVALARLLRDLRVLVLWIGPHFAPEHMEVCICVESS